MAIVEGKRVWASQTMVWIDDNEIEGYQAECIVKGCERNNLAYLITADEPKDNRLEFIESETCEHLTVKETDSTSNYEYDAIFEFGIVLGQDEFLPPEKCWNLLYRG
jgi:hypothetical protein